MDIFDRRTFDQLRIEIQQLAEPVDGSELLELIRRCVEQPPQPHPEARVEQSGQQEQTVPEDCKVGGSQREDLPAVR